MWKILLLNPCIYKSDFTRVTYTCKNYKCNFFIELTPGLYILWFMVGYFISLATCCINETFKNYLKPFWVNHFFTKAKNSQLRFGAQSQEKHTHERHLLNQKEKSPILVSRGRVVKGSNWSAHKGCAWCRAISSLSANVLLLTCTYASLR